MRFLAGLIALAASAAAAEPPVPVAVEPAPGVPHAQIACSQSPGQSYALYLPSGYTTERAWPVIYCFDPRARGSVPVERLQVAAERHGFILAGSNNSRNGPWDAIAQAAEAMQRDVEARYRVDPRRRYGAGFSGGARAACALAAREGWAAVIACSGGFPGGTVPPTVGFGFFGTAGRDDFNHREMVRVHAELDARPTPHRFVEFDGGHEWLSSPVALRALEWIEVQAMRDGRREPDAAWLQAALANRLQAAAQLADGPAYEECAALAADFAGLVDTTAVAARVAALQDTRKVRGYLRDKQQSEEEEAGYLAELARAIAAARGGGPAPGDVAAVAEEDELGASTPRDWLLAGGVGPDPRTRDPSEALKALAAKLQRRAEKDAAARRALNAGFFTLAEDGRAAMRRRDFAAAAGAFGVAALIQPDGPVVHFELAGALALSGQKEKARKSLQAAVARGYRDQERITRLHQILAEDTVDETVMQPFFVSNRSSLQTSFGLALAIAADPQTRQIVELKLTGVAPGSEAEFKGLKAGDLIVTADGRSVRTLLARFDDDSEFSRLFMDRRNGDVVELEVRTGVEEATRVVKLTQRSTPFDRWNMLDWRR